MTLMDPIGDMLTRIRNGQSRLLPKVEMPSSTLRLKILEVLKTEGFISSYHIEKKENNKRQKTTIIWQICSSAKIK